MKRAFATALLFVACFGMLHAARAQFGAEPLTLTITPSYPKPFQSITVVPESTVIDLSSATVVGLVNGSEVARGSGAEPIYARVGAAGTATTITVRATVGGTTYTKTLTVRPADVALIVEPQSTIHPFYEGGSLVSSEGNVRLIAVPDIRSANGALVPAANLVYTWRNGDQVLQASSGIGKSVLTASAPVRHRDARVTVTVTTQDRSVVAETSAVIFPQEPLIRVYRHDPLLGPLFGTALPRNITLRDGEETFRAVPYFFPDQPAITWQVNGQVNDTGKDITLRANGTGQGSATVHVSAKTAASPYAANTSLRIQFGEQRGFNIFGL